MIPNDDAAGVASLETSIDIIEHLERNDGARIVDIAAALDLSKSAVHKHLTSLRQREYVVQEGDEYHLGLRFTYLGEGALTRKEAYIRVRNLASRLSTETGLESGVIIEENGRGAYLKSETEDVDRLHMGPKLGERTHLHTTAAGKSILAAMPTERVERIVDRWSLPARTENTITDRDELLAALDQIRERGYAINDEENSPGIQAIATDVREGDGTVLCGIGLTVPHFQTDSEWFQTRLPQTLLDHVAEFEETL
jgi:DNA-binding IclR family transcriptional regulator